MPGRVGGGPKPPVSTDIQIQPETSEDVSSADVLSPSSPITKPPVDELVHSDHGVRSEARELPALDNPTRSPLSTEAPKRLSNPPPVEDVERLKTDAFALASLGGAVEITEVKAETFGDAFDDKWEIVHPGDLAGLSPRSSDEDFDRPPLKGNPVLLRIKLKEPAPGRLFNVKVGGPEVSVKDAVCVKAKNSAKVIDRMVNAGMQDFQKIKMDPAGSVNVHAPKFQEGGALAAAFKVDGGARLEVTADQDTLLHREDGTVDTSQVDFFRNRAFSPKLRDEASSGTPSSNEAEAIVKYAKKASANGQSTEVPGDIEAPVTDTDEVTQLKEELAAANQRTNQAEASARNARVKGMLHRWNATAQKSGRERLKQEIGGVRSEASDAAKQAKSQTTQLEGAISALTEKSEATEAENLELQGKLEEATMNAVAAKVVNDAMIGALSSQAEGLEDKLSASTARIGDLQKQIKAQKKDLKEGRKTSTNQEAKITKLEEDLNFTEALREDLVSQRDELYTASEGLRTENEALTGQLETASKKLNIARSVIVSLQGNVASSQSEVKALQGELATAKSEATGAAQEARRNTTELQTAIANMSAEKETSESENQNLQSDLQDAAMAAVAAKVASDAVITALSDKAQGLENRTQEQGANIGELKAQIKAQKKIIAEAGNASESQTAQISKLAEDLEFTETLREDLVSQRNELHESVEGLRKDNAALTGELETANKKLGIARNVIVALQGDVAGAREEVQSLHAELDSARSEARTASEGAKASIASLQSAVENLTADKAASDEEVEGLQGQLQDAAMAAAALKVANDATIAALSGEAQDLKARTSEQGTRIGELKAEISERKKAMGEGNKLTESQSERIAKLEEDLDFTEALRSDLVSQRNELHENVESLRKDNAALTGELSTANRELDVARNAIVGLQSQVAGSQNEVTVLRDALSSAQAKAEQATSQAQSTIASLEDAIQTATEDNAELQTKLQSASTGASKVQADNDATISSLNTQVSSLGDKMEAQAAKIKELKAGIGRRKKTMQKDNKLTTRQANRITRLEGDLDFAEALRVDLVSQRNELHEKVKDLRHENNTLGSKLAMANKKLGVAGNLIGALKGKLSQAENETRAVQDELGSTRTQAKASAREARESHASMQKAMGALRTAVKAGDATNQKLTTQLEMSVLNAAQTQTTNGKTMARLRDKISGLQSGMSQRESKIGELETAIAEQSKAMRAGDSLALNQQAQLSSLKCSLQGLRKDLSATRTLLDSANDELAITQQANQALQSEVESLSDEKSELSEALGVSKDHIHKLIRMIAAQGGTIDYQEGELEELQDILEQYEASASAPWLSRLRGLLGELLA